MSCAGCECVVGQVYDLDGGTCDGCGSEGTPRYGTYLGLFGQFHKFRVHNHYCPGCGSQIRINIIRCENLIDVTQEYRENIWSRIKED